MQLLLYQGILLTALFFFFSLYILIVDGSFSLIYKKLIILLKH